MAPQSQRRSNYRAKISERISDFTVSNNPSSSPIGNMFGIPSASPNPSPGFGFSPNSSSSTTASLFGGGSAPSSGLGSSNSSPASSLFGTSASSSPFGGLGLFGPSTGANTFSSLFGSSVSDSSPKTISAPSNFGSGKSSTGSETPVHEKSVIEEEDSSVQEEAISQTEDLDFDGPADKAAILRRIQRMHPSCLPSLRLRAKAHRRSAYDHLVQVILDLKAIGGNGDPNAYADLIPSLDDLDFYGFEVNWLRDLVLQLQKNAERRREVITEKEAKRKAREELLKQLEAIDAELAADDPPPVSMDSLSALFESP